MENVTFCGLNQIEINFWAMISQFLAAFGTISAVILALYLSLNQRKVKLQVKVEQVILFDKGRGLDIIQIIVINTGFRLVEITGIGWALPSIKQNIAHLSFDSVPYSDAIPTTINFYESKKYFIRTNELYIEIKNLINVYDISGDKLTKNMRLKISTTIGKNFECKIPENLRKLLSK